MRRTAFVLLVTLAAASTAAAQPAPHAAPPQTSATPSTIHISVDQAVKMALDQNVDLRASRLDPQISDTRVAAAAGAFRPSFNTGVNRNNQLLPPSSFLFPVATRNDVVTSSAGVGQRLPWFGTSYAIGWNAVHTDSNSFLNSYNPLLQSGLSLTLSQPLLRDLKIDPARQNLQTSQVNREIADTQLREALVHTTADTKAAYWNLKAARANVDARRKALELAEELVRVNTAKVNVGQSPPLDLVSAQAEVASDQEQLIIAETAVKEAEDRLRLLIFDPTQPDAWTAQIDTSDPAPIATATIDLDAAVGNALKLRTDLDRARRNIENADITVKGARNQKLPDVRASVSYQASGLGGTQVNRDLTKGFPGTIIGAGSVTPFGTVLNQLFTSTYPTWVGGVNVTYPIGHSTEDANYAQAQLQRQQAEERLKGDEARAIQQVRDAGWKVQMNAKRIDTTRAARELAEQRLDAEQKRFDVGMSTSFLVIQAQRDLAQARTNELSAMLGYALSLVDFEALQQAGPAGAGGGSSSQQAAAPAGIAAAAIAPAVAAAAASATAGTSTGAGGIPGGR